MDLEFIYILFRGYKDLFNDINVVLNERSKIQKNRRQEDIFLRIRLPD